MVRRKVCRVCNWWVSDGTRLENGRLEGLCHYDPPTNGGWPVSFDDFFCHCWEILEGLSYDEI